MARFPCSTALVSISDTSIAVSNLSQIFAIAKGECIRCLDPVEIEVERKIQELYRYEPTSDKGGKRGKKAAKVEEDDLASDEELFLDGSVMDLEIPIRDAIVLDLPANPLCSEGCLGLCPDCGEKWERLPQDHAHEAIDARWARLQGLDFKNSPE